VALDRPMKGLTSTSRPGERQCRSYWVPIVRGRWGDYRSALVTAFQYLKLIPSLVTPGFIASLRDQKFRHLFAEHGRFQH